jgi:hypothetical protein
VRAPESRRQRCHRLPFTAGEHANLASGFRLFLMPDPFSEVVCVESEVGLTYLEPPNSTRYLRDYNDLVSKALDATDSIALMSSLAVEMERR